jgi:iron complex transport system permease protein
MITKKYIHWGICLLLLFFSLAAAIIFALCHGPVKFSPAQISGVIFGGAGGIARDVILNVRLPRIILALAVGGALSLTGVILQGLFRNPLVEPYTLGISGAAALGAGLSIILGLAKTAALILPLFSFLGAAAAFAILYFLNSRRGILKMEELLLTGVMMSFISASLIMLIMSVCRREDLRSIIFWTMGSLSETNWVLIKTALCTAVAGLAIAYLFALDLNAFTLGEEEARHLGVDVDRVKRTLFILASLLTGVSVSAGGIIGFVGLAVPHFVRIFFGNDYRVLLAGSFLAGAAFLIFCDTLARTIVLPMELPAGVITGIIGGSFFIYALTRRKVALGEK